MLNLLRGKRERSFLFSFRDAKLPVFSSSRNNLLLRNLENCPCYIKSDSIIERRGIETLKEAFNSAGR